MLHRRVVAKLCTVAMLTLVPGCAAASKSAYEPGRVAFSSSSDLVGTWTGTAGWVGAHQYEGESRITIQIKPDGTFTARVTPNRGTNNLARASTLSGTVVDDGTRVKFLNSQGPWTSLTLVRSGDALYGAANDPAFESNVLLRVQREGGPSATAAASDAS